MGEHRLLIADGSSDFRQALSELLKDTCQIRCCADGMEAYHLLEEFQPKVLVMDLVLPGMDGITLMQTPLFRQIHPLVLATTRFSSDYLLDSVEQFAVSYLMLKPCEIQAVADRVTDLLTRAEGASPPEQDLNVLAALHLRLLGINSKHNGYLYLQEAIPLCIHAPGISMTKELYPTVAQLCNSVPSHVERSIRSAIEKAYAMGRPDTWKQYFPCDANGNVIKPSNARFIRSLAEVLQKHLPINSQE